MLLEWWKVGADVETPSSKCADYVLIHTKFSTPKQEIDPQNWKTATPRIHNYENSSIIDHQTENGSDDSNGNDNDDTWNWGQNKQKVKLNQKAIIQCFTDEVTRQEMVVLASSWLEKYVKYLFKTSDYFPTF